MSRFLSIVKIISIAVTIGLLLSGCGVNLPDTPQNLTATAYSSGAIIISWDPVSNADGYYLHLVPNVGGFALTGNKFACTDTEQIHYNLYADTLYSYKVTAYNSNGESSFSNTASARTFAGVPNPPADVSASAASESSIIINWSAVKHADGYKIYRSNESLGYYTEIDETESTSYTDTDLPVDVRYYYKVSAYNISGESTQSSSVYSQATTIPAPPSEVTATTQSVDRIIINWPAVHNADSYVVYRSLSESGVYTQIGTTTESSYTSAELIHETTYYYKVAAKNGIGEGSKSNSASATTLSGKPKAPSYLSTSNITLSSIRISWSSVSVSATEYIVYRSSTDTNDYNIITTINSSYTTIYYTDSGLNHGTTYYYKIAARNNYGDSPPSDVISATTLSAIELTKEIWADGSLPTSSSEQWFCFTATAATQYVHVILGTLTSLYIQLYDVNMKTVGSQSFIYSSTKSISQTTTIGQVYYIKSSISLSRGTYKIAFNDLSSPPPPESIQLTEKQWADGDIPSSDGEQWFSFTATAATQYVHVIFGTLSDLYVQLYNSSLNTVGSRTNLYSSTKYTSRTLTIGQVYYILVTPYSSSYKGTYQIAFNSSITKPLPPLSSVIQLTEVQWANGNIPSSGGDQWFSFTATAATQYVHISFGTLNDLYVQLYDSSLNTVGSQENLYSSTKYISRTLTIGQMYYILVTPYSSSGKGTYKVAFNTSATAPPQ